MVVKTTTVGPPAAPGSETRPGHRHTSPTPLLRVEGLRRRYGGRLVVDIADLELRPGEVLAVLGPNGAGKSTLFRLLHLLEKADAGRIAFEGREVRCGDRAAQRRMAGVFQRPCLFQGTVEQNVAFGLRARRATKRERAERVAEVLGWLGLTRQARAPIHALSGGEAQRVALARALAPRPEILFLDEPTANLDVDVRRRFREDLARLVRTRTRSALLITHDPGDAFALADRIAVLQEGRIVQVGRPDEVVARPATPFVAAFTGAELLPGGVVGGRTAEHVAVTLPGSAHLLAAGPAAPLPPGTPIQIAYRPEDVELAEPDAPADPAENRLRVHVAALDPGGALVRVRLEGGAALTALATRRTVAALGLVPGHEVIARIDPSALHVFPAPPGPTAQSHP